MEAKLKETKILINSILTASENALSLGQLEADYKMMENEYIPFKEFGFKSLLEFLQSCKDEVKIIHVGGTAQLLPVVGDESKHIFDLVQNQKRDPSKKVPYKITHAVEENILRLLGRAPNYQLPLGRLSSAYLRAYQKPLPSPKGKLVAWLGTSNRFAILAMEKNFKIIEPLSTVDMKRYDATTALRDSVRYALSGAYQRPVPGSAWQAANQQTPSASSYHGISATPRTMSAVSSHHAPGWTQNASTQMGTSTSGCMAPSYTAPATFPAQSPTWFAAPTANTAAQFSQPQFSYTQSQPSYTPPQPSYNQPQPSYTQPPLAKPTQGPQELTPEVRQLLLKFMMKNPESTSVPALHKAYEYHHGPIDIKTFLSWLISMEECLVIGSDKGRVYMRPEYRPTAELPDASAMTPDPYPLVQSIDPATRSVQAAPSVARPHETLKITVRTNGHAAGSLSNGWQRVVETSTSTDGSAFEALARAVPEVTQSSACEQVGSQDVGDVDHVLEGISGLCVTDIIDVIEMMRRRPKVPLDLLLGEFEETFQKTIEPNDGVEGLVESLCRLGLLKIAPNSDVSLFSPVRLRNFEYESGQWLDVTEDEAFWNKFTADGILTEGVSVTGKVASYNETGFTFAPNWCPPDNLYGRAEIKSGGEYIYSNGQQKLRAVAHSSISMAGHWLIYLPDLKRYKPCRREQLFVGPPQPVFDVIPIGRCPPVGEDVKLKIVQVTPTMTFACVDEEEPCCNLKSKADSNFNFRVLHWDNQRFIPREDLAKLSLDKGLTSMDSSAIGNGEYFAAGSWMKNIQDPFFIPMIELVELLETEGFREDAIHDLLLI